MCGLPVQMCLGIGTGLSAESNGLSLVDQCCQYFLNWSIFMTDNMYMYTHDYILIYLNLIYLSFTSHRFSYFRGVKLTILGALAGRPLLGMKTGYGICDASPTRRGWRAGAAM